MLMISGSCPEEWREYRSRDFHAQLFSPSHGCLRLEQKSNFSRGKYYFQFQTFFLVFFFKRSVDIYMSKKKALLKMLNLIIISNIFNEVKLFLVSNIFNEIKLCSVSNFLKDVKRKIIFNFKHVSCDTNIFSFKHFSWWKIA